jgi:drug/metabolite transporter (DMT)-like permease
MTLYILALIGPLLYATANHIDKILLTKYFKYSGVGTLMLFSSLLSGAALPFLYLADPTILDVDAYNIILLSIVGLLNIAILWLYFLAMKDAEASVVVVFYQLVPVFGYILGYFILGESLTTYQLFAMSIILLGTTIISLEFNEHNHFSIRYKTALYMVGASFFWALSSVVFKFIALEENVLRSLFWEHVALMIFGIILFTVAKTYRINFIKALKENSKKIISLNFVNETIYITGTFVFSFAYLMAPVALVLLANSFQSFFVLVIGIMLTIFFPQIGVEKINPKTVLQKAVAITITGVGTYLLLAS